VAQVHALLDGEPQRVGQCEQHLTGRVPVATLFEAGEVFDADPGERRQLGPAQAGRPAPAAGREPHLGRRHRLAARPQVGAQLVLTHRPNLPCPPALIVALPVPA
jgi:hypothetical protein